MVVFDSAVLLLFLNPNAKTEADQAARRIKYLIETLAADKEKIVIPTPVLSEILVHAGPAMPRYLDELNVASVFRIAPFDQRAAIECALVIKDSLDRGGLRVDASDPVATRAKVKFDRQIVAIAKVEGAHTIYTDDDDVVAYARQAGIRTHRTAELDLPPDDPQHSMDFGGG